MKVVEVVETNETDPAVLERGIKWVDEIGKVSVLCKDTPGTFFRDRLKGIVRTIQKYTILPVSFNLNFHSFAKNSVRIYREPNSGPNLDAVHGRCGSQRS